MNKAVELLQKSKVFYIATIDGDQPRVRPYGAVAEIDGKLYICTNNKKPSFRQMQANPKVEISGLLGEDKWFRINGIVKVDSRTEVRAEFLKQVPLPIYKADDGIFEVLYFESGTATISSFTGEPETFAV